MRLTGVWQRVLSVRRVRPWLLLLVAGGAVAACSADSGSLPLVVDVFGRSMSKLPFVIAEDQGLYEKYGLMVELRLPAREPEGPVNTNPGFWAGLWATAMNRYPSIGRQLGLLPREVDIQVSGHTPSLVGLTRGVAYRRWVALAATDCAVRYYVIGRPGMNGLDQLEGKRLGVGRDSSTSGFAALRLIQRMGWVRDQDIFVVESAGFDELLEGTVDAVVGEDATVEAAEAKGFPILEDTRVWKESLAGNSVMVEPGWLDDATNREAARRFLMAMVEAIAMFHDDPELVVDVMARWHGVTRDVAETRYRRADYVPRKPYPCREGIRATMALYDSPAMRAYALEDFYDDSLMRELDESGFIDAAYE